MGHNLRMAKDGSPDYKIACGRRLIVLRTALGFPDRASFVRHIYGDEDPVQFKRDQDRVEKWEKGDALVPPVFVGRLKLLFAVTHDYIFAGDFSGLPRDLAIKVMAAEKSSLKFT